MRRWHGEPGRVSSVEEDLLCKASVLAGLQRRACVSSSTDANHLVWCWSWTASLISCSASPVDMMTKISRASEIGCLRGRSAECCVREELNRMVRKPMPLKLIGSLLEMIVAATDAYSHMNELLIIVAIYIASATDRMRVEIDGLAAHMYRYKRV